MKPHVTEEGKTAQDNFTNAMKKLFRTPKASGQRPSKQKPNARKKSK
jgi:hypothetical protein